MEHDVKRGFGVMQQVVCKQCRKKFPTGKIIVRDTCGYCRRGMVRACPTKGTGLKAHPEAAHWRAMKNRCLNPKASNYRWYGGRGVSVCDRWRESFAFFLADMGPIPSKNHTINRIDNSGNYEPGNCRWATKKEQMRNMSTNRLVAYEGVSRPLAEWAEVLGLKYKMLHDRLGKHGWTIHRAFTTPRRAEAQK